MSPWSYRYFLLPDPTQFSHDRGLITQDLSVHTCQLVYSGHKKCLELTCMCPCFMDTSISLIWHIWSWIWAREHKNIVCLHIHLWVMGVWPVRGQFWGYPSNWRQVLEQLGSSLFLHGEGFLRKPNPIFSRIHGGTGTILVTPPNPWRKGDNFSQPSKSMAEQGQF